MKKKAFASFAGVAVTVLSLASPASAATGRERFTEMIRLIVTPAGETVTSSSATAGGLIRGIGTVSLDGLFTLRTVRPNGPGTFSLGATTTNVSTPDNDPCGSVTKVTGTFEITMGSGTGVFANAQESGTFELTETINSAMSEDGLCSPKEHIAVHMVANGMITVPSSNAVVPEGPQVPAS